MQTNIHVVSDFLQKACTNKKMTLKIRKEVRIKGEIPTILFTCRTSKKRVMVIIPKSMKGKSFHTFFIKVIF
jgi:hypothetical protein